MDTAQLANLPVGGKLESTGKLGLRQTSHLIENAKLASLPPLVGKFGTLASCSNLPACHTRKGGKRQASPANCPVGRSGMGQVESVRFTLTLLERSGRTYEPGGRRVIGRARQARRPFRSKFHAAAKLMKPRIGKITQTIGPIVSFELFS